MLCASDMLCHPILFEDDFEDGVIAPEWTLLRFVFEETGGKLRTTTTTRPGFNYGHTGNGRSAVAQLAPGDMSWTDVRVEWDQQNDAAIGIVDPGLPACQHTPRFQFRIAQ